MAALAAFCAFGLHPAGAQTVVNINNGNGFIFPAGVAVDSNGNLFVADQGDDKLLEVLAAGGYTTINSLAPGNYSQPADVAIDGNGNLFVVNTFNNSVTEVPAAGGYSVASTIAVANGNFSSPHGIAVDSSGNVFVADSGNHAVKEILASSGYVTVNSLAAGSFNSPESVAIDSNGNVFVADRFDNSVKEISASSGYTVVNSYGLGNLNSPRGVAVDANDNIIVSDSGHNAVKEILISSGYTTINTLATGFNVPLNLVVDGSGNIFVADNNANAVKEILAPPSVSAISPASGAAAGGASVTITGTNLTNASAVSFGSTAAPGFTVDSATQITVISPSSSAGTVDVTVTTPEGTSAAGPGDKFTYIAAPIVSTVSPSSGPTSGGTVVVITGANMMGANAVSFGGTAAASFVVDSATQITATAPAGSAGTVDITVTTAGGTSATTSNDSFTYAGGPTVSAVNPFSGPTGGGTSVVITGTNLATTTAVAFGGRTASFSVDSGTQVTAMSPAGAAGTVDITVTTTGGTSAINSGDRFTYVAAPVVTAVGPSSGPPGGGTAVTITGANFVGTSSVLFGSQVASSFVVRSPTQITAISPPGSPGPVDIVVVATDGTSAFGATDKFTYATASTSLASSLNPSTLGTSVTFTATVSAQGASPTGAVTFKDGTTILAAVPLSGTSATFTTAGLTVGSHAVTATYDGDDIFPASTSPVLTQTVEEAGTSVASQAFTYLATLGTPGTAGTDNAHFDSPVSSAVDTAHNHLFIADTLNDRVQVLDTSSLAVVATIGVPGVVGNDNSHLNAPKGVGVDAATDQILVADTGNHRIQVFDAATLAYVGTLGQTGLAGSDDLHFSSPTSVQFATPETGSAGQQAWRTAAAGPKLNHQISRLVYIADTGNHRVQIFDAATFAYVGTLGTAGQAGSDNAHLDQPLDAALNVTTNQIMVADSANGRVQLFDAATLAYAGTLGGPGLGPTDNTAFGTPASVGFDATTGSVLVADTAPTYDRVQVFDGLSYGYLSTLGTTGSPGTGNTQFNGPRGVATDPAHSKIFVGDGGNDRVQVFAAGPSPLRAAILPQSRSVEIGTNATVFAVLVNAGTDPLTGCRPALPAKAPAGLTLSYQTTAAATNTLTGTPDTPATIAPGADQTFLLSFSASTAFSAEAMPLAFLCDGAASAPVSPGVNTVDLLYAATPVPDLVALVATASNDGILTVPFSQGGAAAFAIASDNFGITAPITVTADFNGASLPLAVAICQTDPASGACLSTPAASIATRISAGATPTFAVFAQASAPIAFDPANARIFIRFLDAQSVEHGATSVAVQTN